MWSSNRQCLVLLDIGASEVSLVNGYTRVYINIFYFDLPQHYTILMVVSGVILPTVGMGSLNISDADQ